MIIQLVLGFVATICVHESGHMLAASALRVPWRLQVDHRDLTIIARNDLARLTCRHLRVIASAGPIANILAALLCVHFGLAAIAELNLLFAVVNLLPLPRSDGSRMILPGRAIRRAREAEAQA